jgi:hypothetical protein
MADDSDDAHLRVPRHVALRRFEQQIAEGKDLKRKEHVTEQRTNEILELIASWDEANYRMLNELFDQPTVAEGYRDATRGAKNLAFHSWNGKVKEADEVLYQRIQRLELVYLIYQIAEVTGGPIDAAQDTGGPVDHPQRDLVIVTADQLVEKALSALDPALARSYSQVCSDLVAAARLSWSGTAHEIREILARVLRILAPDEAVTKQEGYVQEKNTTGPTHRQRARYIAGQRGLGSKERDVAEHAGTLDSMAAEMVRDMYSRASDAAHRGKDRKEVVRLLKYLEALLHDLLDL